MRTSRKAKAQLVAEIEALQQQAATRTRAEEWLRTLIDTTLDALITIDREGHILLFNPAAQRMFGYAAPEVIGRKVNVLMPEPYRSEHDEYLTSYEQTHEPRAIGRIRTVTALRKNGEVFPIELSVTELKPDDDVSHSTYYGAFIRDISEKVRLQETLVERERLATAGKLAAKLAHEIGNPLNSMSMKVQLLERHLTKSGTEADNRSLGYVQDIQSEISRLTLLLQDFRAMSRRQRWTSQAVALAPLLLEVLDAEAPSYQARNIHVERFIDPTLPLIQGDSDKLKQVVLNLCKNAVEAMPEGGTLRVRAYPSRNNVCIDITDTGVGIPLGLNVFEEFVTTKASGSGLGLSIVQQLVAAHGGDIVYTSTPGEGTTFTLTLPAKPSSI